jgi:hypothetical protein
MKKVIFALALVLVAGLSLSVFANPGTDKPTALDSDSMTLATASMVESYTSCDCDFNCDGVVGVADLMSLQGCFGCTGGNQGCSTCHKEDINMDGIVSTADYLIFIGFYGTTCTGDCDINN